MPLVPWSLPPPCRGSSHALCPWGPCTHPTVNFTPHLALRAAAWQHEAAPTQAQPRTGTPVFWSGWRLLLWQVETWGTRGPQEPKKPHLTPLVALQVAGGCSCERPPPVERELLSRGQGCSQDQVPRRALQTPLHLLKSADPPGGPQVAPGHTSLCQSPLPGQSRRAPCCTGALAGEGGSHKVEAS